ncbi:MAG TPA: chitobiase/beta-hexosaminidase C-terminal domain-containing protein [Solirubrobacteraceae bacterium]|nr:chitobiase/beta-hexosaminidase C-terminal domain-containing protein [Solirubrobacteraceae bacterium]
MSRIDDRGWKGCQGQAQRRTRRVCAASLGILGAAALAVPAIANTVNDPPAAPHSIISFPQRDFVSAAGFQPSDSVTVSVLRNGVTIGTSEPVTPQDDPKTPGFDGIVEVNHPGGACWQTTTPDILPGDAIRTTVQGAGDEDQTTTAAVTADAPASPAPGTIVVTGSAQDSSGKQLPGAQIEQRLVSGGDLFARNNKRTLRAGAGAGGGDGTLVYDSATSTDFTATYTGLSDADVARALAAESRTLWLGVDPGSGQEGTIYEHGAAGGPTPPCTAPQAVDGVTGSDHVFDGKPTVNVLNAGSDLGLAGLARAEATAVRVKLKDPGGVTTSTVDATLSGAANGQTWTATIPAAAVAGLADGTLTAQATFDTPGGPIPGSSLTLRKDTVTPGDPGATPGPGTYRSTQAVSLQSADPAADVHYTVDGSAPSAASRVAPAQISVTSSLTITAVAVDPAGNASATRSFAYVIETPAASTGGSGGGAAPAATVVRIPAPPPSGGTAAGSPRPKLALASLRTAARMSQSTARKRGLRLTMGLPTGTEIVRIQVYRKTAKGLTLLSDGYRAPSAAGVYRVSQSHAQLRRLLKRGSYEVRVTPGYAKNDLGVTRRVAFKIV